MPQQKLYWGEIHTHTALSDGNGSPEENFRIARSHLDFWAMADHAYDPEVFNFDYRTRGPGREILNDRWGDVQDMCRSHEDPGRFIPLLAYEWTNYRYGHHNVYYLDYDQPIRMPPTLPELYEALRNVEALVIPHHGGYPVGVCGKDWDFHDDHLSPFVEIYSLHGSSEEPDGIRPLLTPGSWMGPGASGGSVQEGLARGYRLGIMASSDSHGDHPGAYDNGLIAAYAEDLSRPALWKSLRTRRIYGVTGDRIALDFRVNGQPMGSVVPPAPDRTIDVEVAAWDKVDRVEVLKNNRVLHCFTEPAGPDASPGERIRFRFMVEWGWDADAAHNWTGCLKVADGRILQAIPCFRGRARDRLAKGVTMRTDSECRWTSNTPKPAIRKHARTSADGLAFELEGKMGAPFQFVFTCDERTRQFAMTPAEILRGSSVVYVVDVPKVNNGAQWGQLETLAKVKVHQGWLSSHLTLKLSCEDTARGEPERREDFYYVRVVQRNGQRAWSSPIWVEQTGADR